MPIEVIVVDNGAGVYWRGQETISGQDLLEATKETFQFEEQSTLLRYALPDFSSIEEHSVRSEYIREMAALDERAAMVNRDLVVALVAPQDFVFGFSRMWEAFVSETGWKTRTFRSKNEAELWIKETVNFELGFNPAFGPT